MRQLHITIECKRDAQFEDMLRQVLEQEVEKGVYQGNSGYDDSSFYELSVSGKEDLTLSENDLYEVRHAYLRDHPGASYICVCPKCGSNELTVREVYIPALDERESNLNGNDGGYQLDVPLASDGFEVWPALDADVDGSTEEERVSCDTCYHEFDLSDITA